MKQEFEIGDRVAVYGYHQSPHNKDLIIIPLAIVEEAAFVEKGRRLYNATGTHFAVCPADCYCYKVDATDGWIDGRCLRKIDDDEYDEPDEEVAPVIRELETEI